MPSVSGTSMCTDSMCSPFQNAADDTLAKRSTVEEGDPEFSLQSGDLAAEHRLDDMQALRGPGEVQLLGDHEEVPQFPQVQRMTSSGRNVRE